MTDETINLSGEDLDLIWYLAGARPCSLETKPGDKDNWIERAGGSLPNYICIVAKGIMRTGKTKSAAIAIAISRIKKWAAGGDDVNADTRVKAAKALAQWTALKAKHAAKKVVKATAPDGTGFIILSSVTSYSLDQVRDAWEDKMRTIRKQIREIEGYEKAEAVVPYGYVREVYVDYIIVTFEDTDTPFFRVPYTSTESGIDFGVPEPIKLEWVSADGEWRAQARR